MFFSIVILELCTDAASSSITSFLFFLLIVSINFIDNSIACFIFSVSSIKTPSFCWFSGWLGSLFSKDCSMNLWFDKFLSSFIAFRWSTSVEETELEKLSKFLQSNWKSSLYFIVNNFIFWIRSSSAWISQEFTLSLNSAKFACSIYYFFYFYFYF